MSKKFMQKQNGFTLIEMLVTMMILTLCTMLFSHVAVIIAKTDIQDERSEDSVAITQLQLMFAQGYDYQTTPDHFQMRYKGDVTHFELYEDKFVKRPGFEVILQNVDDADIELRDFCAYLSWKRGQKVEEKLLGCE